MTIDLRFEIGRTKKIRDQYERGCECVQTKYGLLDGGALSVNNTCWKDDKDFVYILGTAKPRSASQFKLTVQVTGPNADIATFFMVPSILTLELGSREQLRHQERVVRLKWRL
jgi:lipocalin